MNPTIVGDRRTPATPTSVPTPPGNTDQPSLTPSGPRGSGTDHDHTQSEGTYVRTCVRDGIAVEEMFSTMVFNPRIECEVPNK